MHYQDHDARLAVLATLSRVWPNRNSENITPGLIELCREWLRPEHVMAEVGCFAGVSTRVFALFVHTVHAVDPWSLAVAAGYGETPADLLRAAESAFEEMLPDWPNIVRIQAFSPAAADFFTDGSLDAVYIDGAHSRDAFHADVRAWRPKLRSGGLLMGHDLGIVSFAGLGLPPVARTYPESSWVIPL